MGACALNPKNYKSIKLNNLATPNTTLEIANKRKKVFKADLKILENSIQIQNNIKKSESSLLLEFTQNFSKPFDSNMIEVENNDKNNNQYFNNLNNWGSILSDLNRSIVSTEEKTELVSVIQNIKDFEKKAENNKKTKNNQKLNTRFTFKNYLEEKTCEKQNKNQINDKKFDDCNIPDSENSSFNDQEKKSKKNENENIRQKFKKLNNLIKKVQNNEQSFNKEVKIKDDEVTNLKNLLRDSEIGENPEIEGYSYQEKLKKSDLINLPINSYCFSNVINKEEVFNPLQKIKIKEKRSMSNSKSSFQSIGNALPPLYPIEIDKSNEIKELLPFSNYNLSNRDQWYNENNEKNKFDKILKKENLKKSYVEQKDFMNKAENSLKDLSIPYPLSVEKKEITKKQKDLTLTEDNNNLSFQPTLLNIDEIENDIKKNIKTSNYLSIEDCNRKINNIKENCSFEDDKLNYFLNEKQTNITNENSNNKSSLLSIRNYAEQFGINLFNDSTNQENKKDEHIDSCVLLNTRMRLNSTHQLNKNNNQPIYCKKLNESKKNNNNNYNNYSFTKFLNDLVHVYVDEDKKIEDNENDILDLNDNNTINLNNESLNYENFYLKHNNKLNSRQKSKSIYEMPFLKNNYEPLTSITKDNSNSNDYYKDDNIDMKLRSFSPIFRVQKINKSKDNNYNVNEKENFDKENNKLQKLSNFQINSHRKSDFIHPNFYQKNRDFSCFQNHFSNSKDSDNYKDKTFITYRDIKEKLCRKLE